MKNLNTTSVGIVGAGSVGIMTGYHLSLAGANVTYVVRPHREEQLSRPQVLYSYDDHSLKTYSGYQLITDPEKLAGTSFDFVIITLDGASLRAEAGQKVVDEIGRAYQNTSTAVILCGLGIELRSWFLERSGLADSQVTLGDTGALIYEVKRLTMPLHPGVKPDLLEKADYAYHHLSPFNFSVDLSAPKVAHDFAAVYERSGVLQCNIVPVDARKISVAMLLPLLAMELLDWPAIADIDPADEKWQLGIEAMREFQRLSIFGPAGRTASEQTNADGVLGILRQLEELTLPMDFAAFNQYHHGGKVNKQDIDLLHEALSFGEVEEAEMPALRKLISLLSNK